MNHDAQNRLMSAAVAGTAATTVGYDAQGNLTSTIDPLGETPDSTRMIPRSIV